MAEPSGRPKSERVRLKTAHQKGLGFNPSPEFSYWTLTNYFKLAGPQFPHLQYFLALLRGLEVIMHEWHLACFKQQSLLLLLLLGRWEKCTEVEVTVWEAAGKSPPACRFPMACPAWEISNKHWDFWLFFTNWKLSPYSTHTPTVRTWSLPCQAGLSFWFVTVPSSTCDPPLSPLTQVTSVVPVSKLVVLGFACQGRVGLRGIK